MHTTQFLEPRPPGMTIPASSLAFTVPLNVTVSIGTPIGGGGMAASLPIVAAQPQSVAFDAEAVPAPDFEVARAITAYVPLLTASYQLAAQTPFQLPAGYTRLADVRGGAMEAAEIELALTPDQQRAVEHDRKALIQGATPGITEGLADPSAFGFVVKEDATGAVLISIRGTQTPAEWLADFIPVPVPFFESPGMGFVHVGFDVFYHKVRGSIQAALSKFDSATRITVIGHSLGGAMAILCAADIERNMGKQNVDVCTFGGPRTGKIDFRIRFNHEISKCFRAVNAQDIVPHVPSVITGWNHVGVEIPVDGKGPGAHSLEAYLNGLKHLQQPGGTEAVDSAPQVLSIRIP